MQHEEFTIKIIAFQFLKKKKKKNEREEEDQSLYSYFLSIVNFRLNYKLYLQSLTCFQFSLSIFFFFFISDF